MYGAPVWAEETTTKNEALKMWRYMQKKIALSYFGVSHSVVRRGHYYCENAAVPFDSINEVQNVPEDDKYQARRQLGHGNREANTRGGERKAESGVETLRGKNSGCWEIH